MSLELTSEQLLTMICFHNEISLFEKNTKMFQLKTSFFYTQLFGEDEGFNTKTQRLSGYA